MLMKTAIITGGSSGLGLGIVQELARLDYYILIASRSAKKAERARDYVHQKTVNARIEHLPLNLASLESIRQCVKLFNQKNLSLDLLINNAGIFDQRGMTQEGFELIWGTNYLGHFLLTYLLWDRLVKSSRILMISSDLALKPREINWDLCQGKTPLNFLKSYELSKLCLLVLTQELSQKSADVTINAIHPGFVQSHISIGHRLSGLLGLGLTPEKAARIPLLCATSPDFASMTGKFFDHNGQEIPFPSLATDPQLRQELWERSLAWTGCVETSPQEEINYGGKDGIWGPYSLNLTPDEITKIREEITQQVLPKIPIKLFLSSFLKALFRFQFGSMMLMGIEIWKRQFYMERHLDSTIIWTLCQNQYLLKKVREFLGDNFNLWRSEIWVNYPSHQLIPFWHKDLYPHLLSGEGKTLNVYLGLSEVTPRNGFEFIPENIAKDCPIKMTDPFSGNHFFDVTETIQQKAIPVRLKPGEFILFTDELLHRSVHNTSGKVRVSLTLRIAQPTVKVSPGYSPHYHPPVILAKKEES